MPGVFGVSDDVFFFRVGFSSKRNSFSSNRTIRKSVFEVMAEEEEIQVASREPHMSEFFFPHSFLFVFTANGVL